MLRGNTARAITVTLAISVEGATAMVMATVSTFKACCGRAFFLLVAVSCERASFLATLSDFEVLQSLAGLVVENQSLELYAWQVSWRTPSVLSAAAIVYL